MDKNKNNHNTNIYYKSKEHFVILDGIRGIGTIMVVCYHLFEIYAINNRKDQIINHGYLIVDFFFLLSGFVISYSYDDRWNEMSLINFIKRRLMRLHPMVIIGQLIGLLMISFCGCNFFNLIDDISLKKLIIVFILGMFLIPVGLDLDIKGTGENYPIDGTLWTLLYEYIANLLYGLIFRHFNNLMLIIALILSSFLTISIALNLDPFNLYTDNEGYIQPFTVTGGWSITRYHLYIGFSRLFFPFFCGMTISRFKKFIKIKGGFIICVILFLGCISIPSFGENYFNGLYEIFCIFFIFPIIILIGAGSKITNCKIVNLCKFLGNISYSIYLTHYPFVYLQEGWVDNHKDTPLIKHWFIGIDIFILILLVAYSVQKLYYEPIQIYLKKTMFTLKEE